MTEEGRVTYEGLRDEATGPAGEAWRQADRELSKLRVLYESLREDNRFTEEHKAERSWSAFLEARDKIVSARQQAREALAKQQRSAQRLSIPRPKDGNREMSLQAEDASELLAAQNEADRIRRVVERQQNTRGPISTPKEETLRKEYGRGLELGGVQGAAVCRGVLSAAEEFGVSVDAVVDSYRKDSHRSSVERAQRAAMMAQSIGGKVKEPPYPRPRNVPPQSLEGVLSSGRRRGYAPPPGESRQKARPPWMR